MGERIGRILTSRNIIDYIELSPDITIVELKTPPDMSGKNLVELNLRKKYGITIISIKDSEGNIKTPPDIEYKFKDSDVLTIIGENRVLKKLHYIEY